MGDYFSKQAAEYSRYRPDYPPELYQALWSYVNNWGNAWDCGTGNGQVARVLASRFETVHATDLSAAQIIEAAAADNVQFSVATAEQSGLAAASVDLITVGQAIHWFDLGAFWQECRRLAKPGAVLAFWTYGLASAGLPNQFESHYHGDIVGPYWPPGREHVDCLYETIQAPFPCLSEQRLQLQLRWSLEHYLGYLSSWSATQKYRQQTGEDPVALARQTLDGVWGGSERDIDWPLALKIYAIE